MKARVSVVVRNNQWFAAVWTGQGATAVFGTHFETLSATAVESDAAFLAVLAQMSPFPDLLCDLRDLADQNRRGIGFCHVSVGAHAGGQPAGIFESDFRENENGYLRIPLLEPVTDFKASLARKDQLHDNEIRFVHLERRVSLAAVLRGLHLKTIFLEKITKFRSLISVVFHDEDSMRNRTGRLASRELIEHQQVPLSARDCARRSSAQSDVSAQVLSTVSRIPVRILEPVFFRISDATSYPNKIE